LTRKHLLDVNVLIALTEPGHEHYQKTQQWFDSSSNSFWGACPFTETGFLRITTNPAFRPGPRTLGQAAWVDDHLNGKGPAALPVVAVSIEVGYNQLLRRITGRRTCPVCKSIYNIYLQQPRVDELCDLDGTALTRRSDDTEEVFEERMRAYEAQTAPVVEHYRARGRFERVDGEQPVDAVTAAVMNAVRRLRG